MYLLTFLSLLCNCVCIQKKTTKQKNKMTIRRKKVYILLIKNICVYYIVNLVIK